MNEGLHSNPCTFCIPHVNNFFQITISEFLGRFNDNFHLDGQAKLRLRIFINFMSEKLVLLML